MYFRDIWLETFWMHDLSYLILWESIFAFSFAVKNNSNQVNVEFICKMDGFNILNIFWTDQSGELDFVCKQLQLQCEAMYCILFRLSSTLNFHHMCILLSHFCLISSLQLTVWWLLILFPYYFSESYFLLSLLLCLAISILFCVLLY